MRGCPGRLRIEAVYLADELRHLVGLAKGIMEIGEEQLETIQGGEVQLRK